MALTLFFTFDKIKTLFPPAGAILLIPMVLKTEYLKLLPLEVFIGATVLIFAAKIIFPKQSTN